MELPSTIAESDFGRERQLGNQWKPFFHLLLA